MATRRYWIDDDRLSAMIESFVASVGLVHSNENSESLLRNVTIEECRA
ncbi:hypothetical protein [Aquisalimonas sp.]|nr:hypothetical protein [Aquisalimonas sp.]